MSRGLDRRAAVASVLLVTFLILTVLPWRYYGRLEPSFDPSSFPFSQHHTAAWTDSGWWLAAAVLGVAAGSCALPRGRRAASIATVAAVLALSCWGIRAWQLHHPSRSVVTPTTIAIANFTAGPHLGAAHTGQGRASWFAAAVLVLLLAMSLLQLANVDPPTLLSRSPAARYTAACLLIAFAVLTFVPWYRYPAFDLATNTAHAGHTDAWTTFGIRDYWRLAGVLGLIGALALLLRARTAIVLGGLAALAAVGCWVGGTWQLHHPVRSGGSYVVTQVALPVTSFDTHSPLGAQDQIQPSRTRASTLALGVLVVMVAMSLLRLVIARRRQPVPDLEPGPDGNG